MNTPEQKRLKEIELAIFRAFIDVCDKLNLKYYLLGGTLLGAVRHQGFIPWDDDIDVGMPREDYEIFVEKGQALLPKEYFIQTFKTDPDYAANFAKIRNCGTTFLETSVRNCNINHGVFIDVFPLDVYSADKTAQKRFSFKKTLLTIRVSTAFYLPSGTKSFKIKIANALLSVIYPSYQRAIRARERLYTSFKSGTLIANHSGAWGVKEIVPAEWYGEGKILTFEGLTVRAPAHYELWLTQVYGDYMQLPPVEKRVTHHYTDVIDLDTPYTKYMKKE